MGIDGGTIVVRAVSADVGGVSNVGAAYVFVAATPTPTPTAVWGPGLGGPGSPAGWILIGSMAGLFLLFLGRQTLSRRT